MIERRATVVWEGGLEDGQGQLTANSSEVIVGMPVTWESRTRQTDGARAGRTSPEEMLAAAHASCFAMSLTAALGRAGVQPERVEVVATCGLEKGPEGLRIASVHLSAGARADGLEPKALEEAARAAEERCPVSRALRGNVEVELETRMLEEPPQSQARSA